MLTINSCFLIPQMQLALGWHKHHQILGSVVCTHTAWLFTYFLCTFHPHICSTVNNAISNNSVPPSLWQRFREGLFPLCQHDNGPRAQSEMALPVWPGLHGAWPQSHRKTCGMNRNADGEPGTYRPTSVGNLINALVSEWKRPASKNHVEKPSHEYWGRHCTTLIPEIFGMKCSIMANM